MKIVQVIYSATADLLRNAGYIDKEDNNPMLVNDIEIDDFIMRGVLRGESAQTIFNRYEKGNQLSKIDEQQQIKVLKKLAVAQNKMLLHSRIGKPTMPEWVFEAIDAAKNMYKVDNISDIK